MDCSNSSTHWSCPYFAYKNKYVRHLLCLVTWISMTNILWTKGSKSIACRFLDIALEVINARWVLEFAVLRFNRFLWICYDLLSSKMIFLWFIWHRMSPFIAKQNCRIINWWLLSVFMTLIFWKLFLDFLTCYDWRV